MSLHTKIVSGAVWSFVEKGGQQGLAFLVFMILARILGPTEYGLANLCFIFFTMASMVTMSLVDGIVSLQVEDDLRLSSLFWSTVAVGLAFSALCLGAAAPLAAFMEEPRLIGLLRWFSVIPILVAVAAVPNLLILKELEFRVYAIRTLTATAVGGAVGIWMASQGFGAYAIIGQQITFFAITNVVMWLSISWRPRAIYSFAAFREVAKPGMGLMSINVLSFLDGQAPRFFIGKLLGPSPLGHFAMATRLRFALTEIFVTSPLAVVYPALAKIDTKEEQRLLAKTITYLGALVTFPILAISSATAPQYVPILFGEKWVEAIPLLQIYIVGAATLPCFIVAQQLFRTHNKMRDSFRFSCFTLVVNLSMNLLLFRDNGLIWMASGIIVSSYLCLPLYIGLLKRLVGISLWFVFPSMGVPALGAVLSFGAIYALRTSTYLPADRWLAFIATAVIGALVYVIFCLIFHYRRIRQGFGKFVRLRRPR